MSKNDFYSDTSDCEVQSVCLSGEHEAENIECLSQPDATKKAKPKAANKNKRSSKSKEEIEYEKTKKKLQQIELRNMKPGECLKHIMVMIDDNLTGMSFGPKVEKALQDTNVKFEKNAQLIPYMISFWRSVTTISEGNDMKIGTKSEDVMQDQIIIYVPREEFISLVHYQNLSGNGSAPGEMDLESFVQKCSGLVGPDMKFTFIILKLDEYLKSLVGKKSKSQAFVVDSMMIEQATLCLQMTYRCHFKFVNSEEELVRMILNYTKSVAECPYKRERKTQQQLGSLYVASSKGCAKLGPEQTWRSQLNVFKNVTADVSNAIAREYPTPKSLFEKYLSCTDSKTAAHLLEDIMIRRGAGITATSRRVGPELSRRVHTLMTSRDGSVLIT